MHDLKTIRENPQSFDFALAKRGVEAQSPAILQLDSARRAAQVRLEKMLSERNRLSREISTHKKNSRDDASIEGDVLSMQAAVQTLKKDIAAEEARLKNLADDLTQILETLPNLPFDDVPIGKDESENVEIRRVGTPHDFAFQPLQHFEIGERLQLMDFETAAKISGARFVILRGALARLERALANYMLDIHVGDHGLTEIQSPALVRRKALYGTGQLPKFSDDLFRTTDDFWLIPTSEVTMTNFVADTVVAESELPLRYVALTPCFRAEAGAAGRDTRGMIRQHQFSKVEMVSLVHPDESEAELHRMVGRAEAILQGLALPYRVVELCTGDLAFGARRTYDIEVWLPGQGQYREISSCSNCWDFQARRMQARLKKSGEKGTRFLHSLNGSGVAIGRCLVAVLENYQNADGSFTMPKALVPYMGGETRVGPNASSKA